MNRARMAKSVGSMYVSRSKTVAQPTVSLMRPPKEVYPLFTAVGAGLVASVVTIYSTFTREGNDVLVDKGNKKYYWDDVPSEEMPQRVSRNPLDPNNTRY